MLKLSHFPNQWKCATIIMVAKSNKQANVASSHRPINVLTTFCNIFEKIHLKRLLSVLRQKLFIPDHQFGLNYFGCVFPGGGKAFGKVRITFQT